MVVQFDEGLHLRRIGVHSPVLGLEFGGPHSEADVVAVDPHTDPVSGADLVSWELDSDSGEARVPSGAKNPPPLEAFAGIPVASPRITSRLSKRLAILSRQ
jgi:hypothetical protein